MVEAFEQPGKCLMGKKCPKMYIMLIVHEKWKGLSDMPLYLKRRVKIKLTIQKYRLGMLNEVGIFELRF